jgi:hydrogenase maturation protease
VNRVLIGGIGNVLLGDDGVGPYVIQFLEAQYTFGDGVEVVDLGTPALDLTHRLVGLHSAILIDSVRADAPAGTIVLYRKEDIFGVKIFSALCPRNGLILIPRRSRNAC